MKVVLRRYRNSGYKPSDDASFKMPIYARSGRLGRQGRSFRAQECMRITPISPNLRSYIATEPEYL